ncbi:MAG TPA: hypothetical protein VJN93_06215 [Candidatus Acidoferrum sp.]|nr:hypothetical protein [Candidatus Acidoferrum sp.]
MPDWHELVEQQLAGLPMDPPEKAEIIAELAAHLKDAFDAFRAEGLDNEAATKRTLALAGDWRDLERKIVNEKKGRQVMKKRFQRLWFPGFFSMVLSGIVLIGLEKLGFQPNIVWFGSKGVFFFAPWLLALLLVGALGSFISLRAGGSRGNSFLASVFPALAMTGALLLMFPIGWAYGRMIARTVDFGWVATTILQDGIGWLVVPGILLLMGGWLAQFLVAGRAQSRDAATV